jgi:hypothetical protein
MDEKRLDRIEHKVDRLDEINSHQNVTLAQMAEILKVNTESLKEHMKRTELNETRIMFVEQQSLKNQAFLKGSIWAITGIWGITLALFGIYSYFI